MGDHAHLLEENHGELHRFRRNFLSAIHDFIHVFTFWRSPIQLDVGGGSGVHIRRIPNPNHRAKRDDETLGFDLNIFIILLT